MNRIRDYIALEYGHLGEGTMPVKQVCPRCNGGSSHERSFSVGRAGAFLWWRCHRASCKERGKMRVAGGGEAETTDEQRGKWHREFKRQSLPTKLKHELAAMYSVRAETIERARWSYTPDYGDGLGARVIYPIFSPDGRVRGEQYRSYDGHKLKAKTNMELAEQAICWYRFRKYSRICVIMEDIPSALRVAETERMDAVALLGTTVNIDRVLEIAEQNYERVWLALDRDATTEAITAKKDFTPYLPGLMVKMLDDVDVKDMSAEQFDTFIQECVS